MRFGNRRRYALSYADTRKDETTLRNGLSDVWRTIATEPGRDIPIGMTPVWCRLVGFENDLIMKAVEFNEALEQQIDNPVAQAIQQGWNEGDESHPPAKDNALVSAEAMVMRTDPYVMTLPRVEIRHSPDETWILNLGDAIEQISVGAEL
jgi:hypothetical protein